MCCKTNKRINLNERYEEGVLPSLRAVGHDAAKRPAPCAAPRRACRFSGRIARERKKQLTLVSANNQLFAP